MTPPEDQPLRLLISFSPEDRELKEQLVRHLQVLIRFAGIDLWTADRVQGGEDWRHEVDAALDRADVALLLMSSDFLASDFLQDVEVPKLFQRREQGGLKVIPVLLRSCLWQAHPWIGALNPLPTNKQAIASLQGDGRDSALTEVVAEIKRHTTTRDPRSGDAPQVDNAWRGSTVNEIIVTQSEPTLGTPLGVRTPIVLDISALPVFSGASMLESVTYRTTPTADAVIIDYHCPYLDKLRAGATVSSRHSDNWLSGRKFPALDFKILNKSNDTMFLTAATFHVDSSAVDLTPILLVGSARVRSVIIVNEGWGQIYACRLWLRFFGAEHEPTNDDLAWTRSWPYWHYLEFEQLNHYVEVSVDEPINRIIRDAPKFLPPKDRHGDSRKLWVAGVLSYKAVDHSGCLQEQQFRFRTTVRLGHEPPGASPSGYQKVTHNYDVALSVGRDKYDVHIPISQTLKASSTDRFVMTLFVEKSSVHRLRVDLTCNDILVSSRPIELHVFVPRSGIKTPPMPRSPPMPGIPTR